MKYDLEQVHFKKWWITRYCREIIENPLFQPTDKEYEEYLADPKTIKYFTWR